MTEPSRPSRDLPPDDLRHLIERAPELTVVVPTWNRAPLLVGLLESLAEQTLEPERFEVVVVDDDSTDGTPETVKRFHEVHPDLQVQAGGTDPHRPALEAAGRSPLANGG